MSALTFVPPELGPDLDPNCLKLIAFLKEFFIKVNLENNQQMTKQHATLCSRERDNAALLHSLKKNSLYSRFWQCTLATIGSQLYQVNRQGEPLHVSLSTKSFEFGIEEEDGVKKPRKKTSVVDILQDTSYNWEEWKSVYQEDKSTKINIPGESP